ncbi:MAG: Gfo/Idh/MocA family oxidoreductase, partial [Cyclobacteriaceae bacterium]|nr:Gfo/Idh/MocA family oxidoreductase [Cyclobacteriaceae bacterium]
MKKYSSIDRRKFIKGTAMVTGGLMVGGIPVEAGAYVNPPEKEIKLALVGCGGRGTGAAMQALLTKENVKLVAMADVFRDRLDSSFQQLTADEVADWSGASGSVKQKVSVTEETKFTGFDAYKKAIALADVVILTTPPGFRPYQMEEAILQNKHIFAEKPLATDAAGVRKLFELVKLADEKKLNVVIGLQNHFSNKHREIIRRVHDGLIGDIVSGQVYYLSEGVWMKERKPEYSELEYQMRNWYYFNWLCGDQIVEQHIHNIDAFNWAKNSYPVSAQGMGGRQVRTGKEYGEIYDHHYVEFSYGDGVLMNSQCRHIKGCMNKVAEHVVGTEGTAELQGNTGIIRDLKGNVIYNHRD